MLFSCGLTYVWYELQKKCKIILLKKKTEKENDPQSDTNLRP